MNSDRSPEPDARCPMPDARIEVDGVWLGSVVAARAMRIAEGIGGRYAADFMMGLLDPGEEAALYRLAMAELKAEQGTMNAEKR